MLRNNVVSTILRYAAIVVATFFLGWGAVYSIGWATGVGLLFLAAYFLVTVHNNWYESGKVNESGIEKTQ